MQQIGDRWSRRCPVCLKDVVSGSKPKCLRAERLGKPCVTCSRSANGAANARIDTCPSCAATVKVPAGAKGRQAVEAHAVACGTPAASLWALKHGAAGAPLCRCGCGEPTAWDWWSPEPATFVKGHAGRLESAEAKAARLAASSASFASGRSVGWSKGLTKATDARVEARSGLAAEGRRKALKDGSLTPWSKGLTKATDARVKANADALRASFASGSATPWAKGLTKEADARVASMAARVSLTHQTAALRAMLDSKKMLSLEEIRERAEAGGLVEFVGVDGGYEGYLTEAVLRCKERGHEWRCPVKHVATARCLTCDPAGSKAQAELTAWVQGYSQRVVRNTRSVIPPLELDIHVEDKGLAIEYNGLYWHSLTQKSAGYHQAKSTRCDGSGVRLFHVFEDEWRDKRPIVESMLRHRLGVTPRNVNARACTVKTLTSGERKAFFEANHIDGDVQAVGAVGLSLGDELVAAVSFRVPFHRKHKNHLEIARLCSLRDTNVRGAMSRLTAAAREQARLGGFTALMTYVDLRFGSSTGTWERSGWTYGGTSAPRWWWTDYRDRFNRFKFRARREDGLTEKQVAEAAGVVRIYGCGNAFFTTPA